MRVSKQRSGTGGENHDKNWRLKVQPGPRQQNQLEKSPAKPGASVSERLDFENREFSLRHYIWRGRTLTPSARALLPADNLKQKSMNTQTPVQQPLPSP